MPADRSRTSDDFAQHYRRVVAQQGRVVLDRDLNAQQEIFDSELTSDALDFVGPVGTPDPHGFEVTVPNPVPSDRDITIGAGTMYVGGRRAWLEESITYFNQPD